MHLTHVKGGGVVFRRNNAVELGPCHDPHLCLGRDIVGPATIKAYALRDAGLWRPPYPPSYYEGSFLQVTLRPPKALLRFEQRLGGEKLFARHLELLQARPPPF